MAQSFDCLACASPVPAQRFVIHSSLELVRRSLCAFCIFGTLVANVARDDKAALLVATVVVAVEALAILELFTSAAPPRGDHRKIAWLLHFFVHCQWKGRGCQKLLPRGCVGSSFSQCKDESQTSTRDR